ncbi:MAG: energy transducer TonB [Taibaiella sp.]|nr:energy transducer TonB [Taibaiella sp.]
MRKLLLLSVLLPMWVHGQQTKFIVKQNPLEYNIERYYALKSDTNVKHGQYKMLNFFGGEPIRTGYYKMNRKDSVWKEFTTFGEVYLQAEGKYKNDKKAGVWTFYLKKNEVEQKYDYSLKKMVYFKPDGQKYRTINGADTSKPMPVERQPLFIGGIMSFKSYVIAHLTYPDEALKKGIQGNVTIAFVIDRNGHMTKVWVKKGVHKLLNDAALKTIKQLPDTWVPALVKGKPVAAVYEHEIPFILQ